MSSRTQGFAVISNAETLQGGEQGDLRVWHNRAARDCDDRVQFGRIDVEVFCRSDLRGQPDAQVLVDRRDVHLLGNGPPIVVRIANARGQDHSIALNLLIWKLRQ